jgi:lysyl-tRNA synthetase class 1
MWKEIFERSNFWAVQVAKKGIERANRENIEIITVRCANTPTGVLHIGNANDVIRSCFIAKCIEVLGHKSRVVFTSDDRDPIRGFPPIICDKEGNLIEFKNKEEYEKLYDGFPVCAIPDPFGCHTSWSEHFISVYFNELQRLGLLNSVKFEYYSPNILYHSGKWIELTKRALESKDKINEIYKELKEHIRDYPFSTICQNCGRIGTTLVTEYNPETLEVSYKCEKRHLKKTTVNGCGYEGKTTIRFGKLDWYVEWALNWVYFQTIIEPMGKDHYTSSWKVSPKIAKEVFNYEAPIPVVYEFFTVNGKKMSGSKGNLWNITEFLKIIEPEVFLYFYTKRPGVARDIDLKNIHLLVNEFDALEEKVYRTIELIRSGELSIDSLDSKTVSERNLASYEELTVYYLVTHGKIENKKPLRVPYNFCAIIGQLLLPEKLLVNTHKPTIEILDSLDENLIKETISKIDEVLTRTGHLERNLGFLEALRVLDRVRKAGYWGRNYAPEYLRISLGEEKVNIELTEIEKDLLREIAEYIKTLDKIDFEEVQTKIHLIIKEKTSPKDFYKKLYKILINKDAGPKIVSLIAALGKEKVVEILEMYLE